MPKIFDARHQRREEEEDRKEEIARRQPATRKEGLRIGLRRRPRRRGQPLVLRLQCHSPVGIRLSPSTPSARRVVVQRHQSIDDHRPGELALHVPASALAQLPGAVRSSASSAIAVASASASAGGTSSPVSPSRTIDDPARRARDRRFPVAQRLDEDDAEPLRVALRVHDGRKHEGVALREPPRSSSDDTNPSKRTRSPSSSSRPSPERGAQRSIADHAQHHRLGGPQPGHRLEKVRHALALDQTPREEELERRAGWLRRHRLIG